jgi:hypothetical protein
VVTVVVDEVFEVGVDSHAKHEIRSARRRECRDSDTAGLSAGLRVRRRSLIGVTNRVHERRRKFASSRRVGRVCKAVAKVVVRDVCVAGQLGCSFFVRVEANSFC